MPNFLIISDLHVTDSDTVSSSASLISSSASADPKGDLMFGKLIKTLEEEDVSVDFIVCPGDLGDKANADGLNFAWAQLNRIKTELRAEFLIGTAGNHDVDSRLVNNEFDPQENLKALGPSFPGMCQEDFYKYWAVGYCIYKKEGLRILNLNSSFYHGNAASSSNPEYLFGRIADSTIQKICNDLQDEKFELNILLTHHHLQKNDHLYDNDNSEMHGAGKLIHRITGVTKCPWIIFHGHQHYPELDYGRGSTNAPIVISAGSFSARLDGSHAAASPNQFYVVEVETNGKQLDGWHPCGQIRAWSWMPTGEWERTPSNSRIPFGAGFGCRINPTQSASRVYKQLESTSEPYLTLEDIYESDPQLKFLLPTDVRSMFDQLETLGVVVTVAVETLKTSFRISQ